MSTGHDLENFHFEVPSSYKKRYLKLNNNVILKSKENIKCSKCTQSLIKKLTKYKLRKNAIEDQDILDISKTFHLRLQLKSPTKVHSVLTSHNENNKIKVTNYLFKMVRHKNSRDSTVNNSKKDLTNIDLPGTENDTKISKNQENKNTNAFHIMMNSRNKVIGSNSPGKERNDDNSDTEEKILLKSTKLKRIQALQKMAESKGSLINKEREELKDDLLRKKMDSRAEKFKEMLKHGKKDKEKNKLHEVANKNTNLTKTVSNTTQPDEKIKEKDNKSMEIISLIDIDLFTPPKEEEVHDDFYDKLSPSLKNRDMLCYFKKVEKQTQNSKDNDINRSDEDKNYTEAKDNIIKVKLMTGKKKKKKKKNVNQETVLVTEVIEINETSNSNNIDSINFEEHNECETISKIASDIKSESRKRKRPNLMSGMNNEVLDMSNEIPKKSRAKRNTTKPLKYDNFSSSDDDFLIFSQKKKRSDKNKITEPEKTNKVETHSINDVNFDKSIINKNKTIKYLKKERNSKKSEAKDTKLAPIFVSKPQIDAEAKKKFLQSGVPEQIKKMQIQSSKSLQENIYFVTNHIQQLNNIKNAYASQIDYYNIDGFDEIDISTNNFTYNKILYSKGDLNKGEIYISGFLSDVTKALQNLKESYPEFPVYRTYHLLKNNCSQKNFFNVNFDNSSEVITQTLIDEKIEDPMTLNWTEKYRIPYAKDIIGNFEGIKELKRWLQSWQENDAFSRRNSDNSDSDSSDFCYYSDTDSRDSMRGLNNILVITGPSGCGKTSSVYAVATELSMKVIEVNVSSKRTGKIILQDLQEATQSHKVNRSKGTSSENSQNSQDFVGVKKLQKKTKNKIGDLLLTKRKKMKIYNKMESLSQSNNLTKDLNRTEMSLILIDDADIIFDQDDGFVTALSQITQYSKRPVILVTSSLTCQYLNKFYQSGNVVKMRSLSPRILGTWLDIMCVSDSRLCWPGMGEKFLQLNKGDIRKTINYLNYLVLSEANKQLDHLQAENTPSIDDEDESSSLSWIDEEINIKKNDLIDITPSTFFKYINVNISYSLLNSMSVWWNILKLISGEKNIKESDKAKDSLDLKKITNVLDCLSFVDTVINNEKNENDFTSDPWQNYEVDGVSENESFMEYNGYKDRTNEISNTMIKCSLLELNPNFENHINVCLPESNIGRKREKKIAMHHSLTESFSNGSILDRRSLATDYWSICRNICRIERDKIDSNLKRNNRFCHYLKSMKGAKNDCLEKLCDSLQPNDSHNGHQC